jgi:hypothetical protein
MTRQFIVGQLAATRFAEYATRIQAGEELSEDDIVSQIGRITAIDGDSVTLKSANGDVGTHDASTLVDVVHFDVTKPMSGSVGVSGSVFAIDHPLLPPNEFVTTSEIKYILDDGKFETRNTLYMPNFLDLFGLGCRELMVESPYLTGEA